MSSDCGVCVRRNNCTDVGEDVECGHRYRLDYEEYYCVLRCGHYNVDHCGLYSINCINDVAYHILPRRFQPRSEVKIAKDMTSHWKRIHD